MPHTPQPLKPPNIIYGVDDSPSWRICVLMGLQHIFVLSIGFVFPVILIQEIGGSPEQSQYLICMAMLAIGIGTVLQGIYPGPVGSGYLAPHLNGPAFVSASLIAGKTGGLPLIFGMTMVCGLFEAAFSRLVRRLRALFPAEVTGTVVLLVGIEVIPLGVPRFFGIDSSHPSPEFSSLLVGLATLAVMVCLSVWSKGNLRLYSVIIGLVVGYSLSYALGIMGIEDLRRIIEAPFFSVPEIGKYGWKFRLELVVPFLAAMLSSALKAMGDLTTCQKINDQNWKRPEMKSISNGILACAVGNLCCGLLGGMGQSTSSSNIGLSIATGVTSRRIAYVTGAMLLVLAVMPKLAAVFVIMPTPIMGAILVYVVSFMLLAGISIMTARLIDIPKTFVIGISLILGLSFDFAPRIYQAAPAWLSPLACSGLTIGTISAIVLNVIFRLGLSQKAVLEVEPGVQAYKQVADFMHKQGAAWGALKEVIREATFSMCKVLEALSHQENPPEKVEMAISFDEFNLEVDIYYRGEPVDATQFCLTPKGIAAHPEANLAMVRYLSVKYAHYCATQQVDEKIHLTLHFDH
ncbi:MAG: uracil-xanthine permease family protein [Desulfobaccales bacterium]